MIIVMEQNATEEQIVRVVDRLIKLGYDIHRSTGANYTLLGAVGSRITDLRELELLEGVNKVSPRDCLRGLALMRLVNPAAEIRIAGGREHNLRSLQPISLYPADSVFVNNYLTTPGSPAPEVWGMIEDLGFKIEVDYQQPVAS